MASHKKLFQHFDSLHDCNNHSYLSVVICIIIIIIIIIIIGYWDSSVMDICLRQAPKNVNEKQNECSY